MGFVDSKHNNKTSRARYQRKHYIGNTCQNICDVYVYRFVQVDIYKEARFQCFFSMTKKGLLSTQYVASENIIQQQKVPFLTKPGFLKLYSAWDCVQFAFVNIQISGNKVI